MTSSKKKKPPSKRSLNTRSLNTRSLRAATGRLITWGFLLCVAASLVLANWPLQYAEILRSQVGTTDDVIDYTPTDSPMPIMAGWPLRYSIAYDDESVAATAEGASATRFSIRALGVNFAVAIAILGLLAGYLYRRKMLGTRSRSEAEDGNGNDQAQRSRLSIADLLFVTMLLAIPLGMKVRLDRITEQEKAFARTISVAGGRADLSAWLPEILADRLPANLRAAERRTRGPPTVGNGGL